VYKKIANFFTENNDPKTDSISMRNNLTQIQSPVLKISKKYQHRLLFASSGTVFSKREIILLATGSRYIAPHFLIAGATNPILFKLTYFHLHSLLAKVLRSVLRALRRSSNFERSPT
jgi:hypothetical protein